MEVLDTIMGDFWVAEYSVSQNAFNVNILKDSLAANARMIAEKWSNNYLIFGIFKTIEEAGAACDEMRRIQEKSKGLVECLSHKD